MTAEEQEGPLADAPLIVVPDANVIIHGKSASQRNRECFVNAENIVAQRDAPTVCPSRLVVPAD